MKKKSKMKQINILIFFDITAYSSFSQKIINTIYSENILVSDSIIIGNNLINKTKIKAIEYSFNNRIYDFYVDTKQKICIGYRISPFKLLTNYIEAYNIENHKFLWDRVINKKYGLIDLLNINDSTLMISAAGLYLETTFQS